VAIFGNNFVGPLCINVGPSLPFHPLHFLFFHSSQISLRVQKIYRSTKKLVFDKMKGGVSNEEAKRLSQQKRDRQQMDVEQKEEEEGTEN
jgi:hypothetical protein